MSLYSHRCLAHVANLAVIDVMKYVTKVSVAESHALIWEFNPLDPENRVLGGQLDVVCAIRTLTVKVREISSHSIP